MASECSPSSPSALNRLLILLAAACAFTPSLANANPVMLNPISLLAFCVVAFWAMVVEAGVVAFLLAFRGVAVLRMFAAYFVLNGAVFLFLFQPLLTGSGASVPTLEALVVVVDAAVIRLLVALSPFQGDAYRRVGCVRSLVTSGIGNALSFLVGYIATRRPWEVS